MKKIIIAGGTGFLGKCLGSYFAHQDFELVILTRGKTRIKNQILYLNWDGQTLGTWRDCLEGAYALINLNGKSVDCRYTEENKRLIYATRLESTAILGKAIQQCTQPPQLWINASSATIYRHSIDQDMDELTGAYGTGFSVDVCQQWERTFNSFETPKTRKVLLRTGIVLGKPGGPLAVLKRLAQLGLGGKQGNGNQYFSWLHERDFVKVVNFIMFNTNTEGVYNVTAPHPVPNYQVMKALRTALGIPFGIPLPQWMLNLGAIIIRTEPELILKSRRVIPQRLLAAGYPFEFERVEEAMRDLLR